MSSQIGSEQVRDAELLRWCSQLITDVFEPAEQTDSLPTVS
jgi:hypothetical protein